MSALTCTWERKTLAGLIFVVVFCFLCRNAAFASQDQIEEAIELAVDARYEEALEIFKDLLRESPDDPLLNYYVGLTHLYLKHSELAIVYLERAVEEEAPFPQAYFWLGKAYLAKEWVEEARNVVKKGLEEYPRNKKLNELLQTMREGK